MATAAESIVRKLKKGRIGDLGQALMPWPYKI